MKKRNKDFDRNIREKLENLAPGFNADSWDKLQDRLDSEDAGSEWDAQLSRRLRQIERPYNRASWQALAERLDLEEKRLNGIYSAKAKELLFMAILLWSVTQFLPAGPVASADSRAHRETTDLPTATLLNPAPAAIAPVEPAATSSTVASAAHSGETAFARAAANPAQTPGTASANLIASFAATPLLTEQHSPGFSVVYEILPVLPQIQTPPVSVIADAPAAVPGIGNAVLTDAVSDGKGLDKIKEFDFLATATAPALLEARERPLEKALSPQPLPRKRFVRVGMMGASDYNRIITPPMRVNTEIVSLDRYALGYSGGITIGFEKDRWEVETGFIYTAKRYYPLQVVYVEGSLKDGIFGSGIKQTEFDIMQIPLNFRYNFLTYDRWRIYGLIGASLHIVAQANYYIADLEDYEALALPTPQPRGGGRDGQERPEELLQSQALHQGWLEGGSLIDNSYLGISAGAGLERYMSPRWSLFAQPTYYHSLIYANKGLGPVHDRIHTMSLFMGVKVRL